MRTIHVTTARELLVDIDRLGPAAVLSIEHPGAVGDASAPRLDPRLYPDTVQRLQIYWDTEEDGHRHGPSRHLVATGLRFLQRYAAKGPLIVHCRSGKARSPAMALAYLVAANPELDIPACMAHLKAIRPQAAPNILVIDIADRVLGLDGRLSQAVRADDAFTAARAAANAARIHWAEKNPLSYPLPLERVKGPYLRSTHKPRKPGPA